ncbi:UNVERIFIED_CONTAM: hypothetical protein FKN15_020437 [Acipenser sinensis]
MRNLIKQLPEGSQGVSYKVNVDPEDLIPKLPKPKDLQPFPTTQSLTAFLLAITSAKHVREMQAFSVAKARLFFVESRTKVTLLTNPAFLLKCVSTFHVNQSVELDLPSRSTNRWSWIYLHVNQSVELDLPSMSTNRWSWSFHPHPFQSDRERKLHVNQSVELDLPSTSTNRWSWIYLPRQPIGGAGSTFHVNQSVELDLPSTSTNRWSWIYLPRQPIGGAGSTFHVNQSVELDLPSTSTNRWSWIYLPRQPIGGAGSTFHVNQSVELDLPSTSTNRWSWSFHPHPFQSDRERKLHALCPVRALAYNVDRT